MSYPVYGMKGLICVILCVWYERVYMCHTLCMVRKGLYVSYPVYGKKGFICVIPCVW